MFRRLWTKFLFNRLISRLYAAVEQSPNRAEEQILVALERSRDLYTTYHRIEDAK